MNAYFNLFVYLVMVVFRGAGVRRRWELPLAFGPQHFFKVPVGEGFYSGPGRLLLRRYHQFFVWPYVAELAGFVFLVGRRDFQHLIWLLVGSILVDSLNRCGVSYILSRSARQYAIKRDDPGPVAVALSLSPRSFADYTNPVMEIILASTATVALVLLAQARAPMEKVLVLLYLQVGMLLLKRALLDWRSAAPAENPEPYLEVREQRRRLMMMACDFYRAMLVFSMAREAIFHLTADARVHWSVQFAGMAVFIAFSWVLVPHANRICRMYRQIKPDAGRRRLTMPDPDQFMAGGLLYFDRDDPALFVRGPRLLALNAGNNRLLLAATYVLGLVLLSMWASRAHAATTGPDQNNGTAQRAVAAMPRR